jgi:hypothetical protein
VSCKSYAKQLFTLLVMTERIIQVLALGLRERAVLLYPATVGLGLGKLQTNGLGLDFGNKQSGQLEKDG